MSATSQNKERFEDYDEGFVEKFKLRKTTDDCYKAVCEIIDGYDAEGVPDNLVTDRLNSIEYSFACSFDNNDDVQNVWHNWDSEE